MDVSPKSVCIPLKREISASEFLEKTTNVTIEAYEKTTGWALCLSSAVKRAQWFIFSKVKSYEEFQQFEHKTRIHEDLLLNYPERRLYSVGTKKTTHGHRQTYPGIVELLDAEEDRYREIDIPLEYYKGSKCEQCSGEVCVEFRGGFSRPSIISGARVDLGYLLRVSDIKAVREWAREFPSRLYYPVDYC